MTLAMSAPMSEVVAWWSARPLSRASTHRSTSATLHRLASSSHLQPHRCASTYASSSCPRLRQTWVRRSPPAAVSLSSCSPPLLRPRPALPRFSFHRLHSSLASSAADPSSSPTPRRDELMSLLQRIPHPNSSGEDIIYAGAVLSLTETHGDVRLVLHLDPHYRHIKKLIQQQLQPVPWITSLTIAMDSPQHTPTSPHTQPLLPLPVLSPVVFPLLSSAFLLLPLLLPCPYPPPLNLRGICRFLAVSSCKGGVGKSHRLSQPRLLPLPPQPPRGTLRRRRLRPLPPHPRRLWPMVRGRPPPRPRHPAHPPLHLPRCKDYVIRLRRTLHPLPLLPLHPPTPLRQRPTRASRGYPHPRPVDPHSVG